ncbi:Helicase [Zea mays]|uniref:Helicase n=1 Tax=Zea mays TaxID=4577 RepID=A0A1D6MZP7_MAIZE|nr:Helicase [Zea mays]
MFAHSFLQQKQYGVSDAYVDTDAYPERSYYGGPEHVCPYCHAVFWFQERVKSDSCSTQRKIVYNLCCRGGKVNLKPFERPPPLLVDLLRFDGGASIDKTINNGTAPYVFKINGVVHHKIGTLLPQRGTQPKFAQLYTYDTKHETQNRLGMFETDDGAGGHPDPEIASSLLDMLNENNSLVKAFRYVRERLEREGDQKITLRLLGCNTRHDVQYNLPSNGEIAAIIVGDYTTGEHTYFGADDVGSSKRKYVTMLEFVRRHLHYRLDEPNPYTCYGRLSDQIDVDAYSTIEGNRLQFIASHQSELRSETVQGIADAIDKGFLNADSIGGRVVVPASFTGGRSNNSSVNVVLWGGQASLFPGEQIYSDGQSSPQILMFVGMLVKKYADGLCLSGGSPCKWYINPDVPEACALMASARKAHSPIKWNEVLSSNQPMPHVPEEQKIACIRDLHPFENKDREFLVTVTVKKIGDRWWYNACKKCTRTAVAHGDSYKCSDQVCATIGTPNQRLGSISSLQLSPFYLCLPTALAVLTPTHI